MNIRRAILALALTAGIVPAFAQVPAPVPALPDTERRTSYSISGTTCACNVNFALYGDSTDYANWLEVFLNGTRVNFNDSTFGWTITSPSGSLATLARPITDAVLTFNTAQTGTVQIVGARRPRRTSQFSESQGVSARSFNQVLTDIISQNRELWDKTNDVTGRAVIGRPGETLTLLPPASSRANNFLFFDSGGNPGISSGGTPIPPVTNPNLAPMPANTIKCNNTGSSATPIDCTALQANTLENAADNYFKSGRPWVDVRAYGALGDGVTDDTTAFTAAVTAAEAVPFGGAVYVPAGNYCVKSGTITLNSAGDRLFGAGQATTISACGVDNTLVKMTAGNQQLVNLQLQGKGFFGDTSSFGATNAVLLLQGSGGGCAQCLIDNVGIQGGSSAISISPSVSNGEFRIYRIFAAYSYGSAIIYIKNGTGWLQHAKIDQSWPVSNPANGTTLNAWAATTAYTSGAVVTLGGYMIQCSSSGTSGGSSPSLKNYGVAITDGTAQWMLAGNATGYALQLDTGTNEVYGESVDMTGATGFGMGMTNTLAGTPPQFFRCVNCVAGQNPNNTFNLTTGSDVYLSNNLIAGGFQNSTSGIFAGNSFSGKMTISGGYVAGNQFGVTFAAGGKYLLSNVIVSGSTFAVAVQTSKVVVSGNDLSGGTGVSITGAGTDYYNIVNNMCGGDATTCVTDTGGGTHKTLSGNN